MRRTMEEAQDEADRLLERYGALERPSKTRYAELVGLCMIGDNHAASSKARYYAAVQEEATDGE